MKQPVIFSAIKKQNQTRQTLRRELIGKSNEALSSSKRSIFALHRGDFKAAKDLLKKADQVFKVCENKFKKFPDLQYEGAYNAALEEYAEALLFEQYLEGKKLGKIDARAMRPQAYLAGLSDTTGEIVRYAMAQVTKGNVKEAARAYETTEMVIEFFVDMDLTGYLRTKFDQGKRNLRRLEEMMYELSLRDK
jgi:predicted translin family RNA/ssDNA-binding protein